MTTTAAAIALRRGRTPPMRALAVAVFAHIVGVALQRDAFWVARW